MQTPIVVLLLVAVLGIPPMAGQPPRAKVVLNTKNGLAVEGYDPVSYFTGAAPHQGSPTITATHLGATYRFESTDNRELFLANPAKYLPQFGGYCGYGASRGYLASVDPLAYTIMNGRLILQNSKRVLELWQKEPDERLRLADQNWPKIVEKEGKPLP